MMRRLTQCDLFVAGRHSAASRECQYHAVCVMALSGTYCGILSSKNNLHCIGRTERVQNVSDQMINLNMNLT